MTGALSETLSSSWPTTEATAPTLEHDGIRCLTLKEGPAAKGSTNPVEWLRKRLEDDGGAMGARGGARATRGRLAGDGSRRSVPLMLID